MNIKPTIVTVDKLVSSVMTRPKIVINGNTFYSARTETATPVPYYANIIKRIIAAGYVLFGKGMVVRFSEDLYKPSEIRTKVYK